MDEERLAGVLKRGIARFADGTEDASEDLLERIMAEVKFAREIDDDDLEFLAAAGDIDMLHLPK